jgi:hypothetical protein
MQGGRGGPKRYSKERPKPSQLTQSEFWGAVYGLIESSQDVPDYADLESSAEEIKSELENIRDETQEKFDNLPEGFQNGQTGEQLQARIDSVDEAISTIEGIDFDPFFDDSEIEEVDEEEIRDSNAPDDDADDAEKEEAEHKIKVAIDDAKAEREAEIEAAKAEKAGEVWQEVLDALDNISD